MQVAIVGFVTEDKDTNYEIRQIKMHALICIDSTGIKALHNYNLSVIFIGSFDTNEFQKLRNRSFQKIGQISFAIIILNQLHHFVFSTLQA